MTVQLQDNEYTNKGSLIYHQSASDLSRLPFITFYFHVLSELDSQFID